MTTPIAFMQRPSPIMSLTSSRPDAKAIALGGVETGRTKAREQVHATGTMNVSG